MDGISRRAFTVGLTLFLGEVATGGSPPASLLAPEEGINPSRELATRAFYHAITGVPPEFCQGESRMLINGTVKREGGRYSVIDIVVETPSSRYTIDLSGIAYDASTGSLAADRLLRGSRRMRAIEEGELRVWRRPAEDRLSSRTEWRDYSLDGAWDERITIERGKAARRAILDPGEITFVEAEHEQRRFATALDELNRFYRTANPRRVNIDWG